MCHLQGKLHSGQLSILSSLQPRGSAHTSSEQQKHLPVNEDEILLSEMFKWLTGRKMKKKNSHMPCYWSLHFSYRVLLTAGVVGEVRAAKVRSSNQWSPPVHPWKTAHPLQMMPLPDTNWNGKGVNSAWLLALPVTHIMRSFYVNHNWSHMSVFSLRQEAESRAEPLHDRTRPPTASRTASKVHCVCWQGDQYNLI